MLANFNECQWLIICWYWFDEKARGGIDQSQVVYTLAIRRKQVSQLG